MTIATAYKDWLQCIESDERNVCVTNHISDVPGQSQSSRSSRVVSFLAERRITNPEQLSMFTGRGKFRKTARPQVRSGEGRRFHRKTGVTSQQLPLGFQEPPEQMKFGFHPPQGTGVPVADDPSLFTRTGRPSTYTFRSQARRVKSKQPSHTSPSAGPTWAKKPSSFRTRMGHVASQMAADELPSVKPGVGRRSLGKARQFLYKLQKSGPTVSLPKKGPIRKHFDVTAVKEIDRIKKLHKKYLDDRNTVAHDIERDGKRRAGEKWREAKKAAKDRLKAIKREGEIVKQKIRSQGREDAEEILRKTQRRANIERQKAKDVVASERDRLKAAKKDIIKNYGLGRSILKKNPLSPFGKGEFFIAKGEKYPPELASLEDDS